ADAFGSQCVVVGIDSIREADGQWRVRSHTGDPAATRALALRTLDWWSRRRRWAPARSSSIASPPTGCVPASTSRSSRPCVAPAACRWLPPAARAQRRISSTCSNRPTWTARWPRASSTPGRSPSVGSNRSCEGRGSRCGMNEHNDIRGMDPDSLDCESSAGLLAAIVQDATTLQVMMLGYMDRAALAATLATGRVTFFSRSRQRAWTKGETSGNTLELVAVRADCDADALLVLRSEERRVG